MHINKIPKNKIIEYMLLVYSALFLVFLCVFQVSLFGIDPDEFNYQVFYQNMASNPASTLSQARFEIGYLWFVYFFSYILGVSYQSFLFASALISISIKCYCFSKLKRPVALICLYMLSLFILLEVVQVRFAMALSFVLLGFEFKRSNLKITPNIIFALALSFHIATALLIIFLLIPSRIYLAINRFYIGLAIFGFSTLLLIVDSGSLLFFLVGDFAPLLNYYLTGDEFSDLNPVNAQTITFLCLTVSGFLRWDSLSSMSRSFYCYAVCGLLLYIVFFHAPVLASRFIEASTVGYLYYVTQGNGKVYYLMEALVFTAFSIYFSASILLGSAMFS